MHPGPFEEWIERGHQRDANLCGAYTSPTDEHSLVRGTTKALLYTRPRRVGVFVEWLEFIFLNFLPTHS